MIQETHELTMHPKWLIAFDVLGRRESPLEEFAPFDAQQSKVAPVVKTILGRQ
jgi:hypothetical protein